MAETFNCPKCGAPLETDGQETTIHCEYCGESVVVPQELRVNKQPQPDAGHIPMEFEQPAPSANYSGKLGASQVRQMMMAIRSGQNAQAASIFQAGTGVNQATAQQTIDMITQQLAISSRILPAELAALLMGAYKAPLQGNYQANQPVLPVKRRRRSGGLGCLLALVIIVLALYLSYTALSPSQLISAFTSGKANSSLHQTAIAPVSIFSTAIAPIMGNGSGAGK